jgi:3'-phosphoadenosine 5'-phosphosulfate sulfotransferase (PAPS reductase)/FAD synthetase
MTSATYHHIENSLRELYLEGDRPWLVGFSSGKASAMLASLVFEADLSVPPDQRRERVAILCIDSSMSRN